MKETNLKKPLKPLCLVTVVLALALTTACKNKSTESTAIRSVYYQVTQSSKGLSQFSIPGVVSNQREANLSFKVSGELTKLIVVTGQHVNEGDVLATLDKENYILNLTQANSLNNSAISAVEKRKKQLTSVESTYLRIEQLYGNNHASLSEYEKAKTNYENAKEGVVAAESNAEGTRAKVKIAQNQLSYTDLIAPFKGTVSQVFIETGEMIGANKPVVVLASRDEFEVRASSAENRINELKVGQEVVIKIASLKSEVKGIIREIATVTKARAGYPIKINFDKKIAGLKSGMSVKVDVLGAKEEGIQSTLIIDPDAVSKRENDFYVYVLTKNEDETYTANERNIKMGNITNEGYIVTKGLQGGELIATAGITFLYDGKIVKLKETIIVR